MITLEREVKLSFFREREEDMHMSIAIKVGGRWLCLIWMNSSQQLNRQP